MKTKSLSFLGILLSAVLVSSMFLVGLTTSQFPPDPPGEYSPWGDLNDDGEINIFDLVWMAGRYGTSGTPVNKTELLYAVDATLLDLLAKIDELNETLGSRITSLEGQTAVLQGQLDVLTTYVGTLQSQMVAMNESLLSDIANLNTTLLSEISNLNSTLSLLDSFVISLVQKVNLLGNQTIPINSTSSIAVDSTTETSSWVDMDDMSVQITLEKPSIILIMFSGEARVAAPGPEYWTVASIKIRALIDGTTAIPSDVYLTPTISMELGYPTTHSHDLGYSSYSYNFYTPSVAFGSYTVKIQWQETRVGDTAYVGKRTLTVIAFPLE